MDGLASLFLILKVVNLCIVSDKKNLRPEIEIIATNYMPEVVLDLSNDFKKTC